MKSLALKLQFISPAFVGGAFPKREGYHEPSAELRASSIRGQLRWWHRFLGKTASEKRIFGSVAGKTGNAAGFTLRLLEAPEPVEGATTPAALNLASSYLLYTQELDNGANHRAALPSGTTFRLIILNRSLSPSDWTELCDTARTFAWLGSLGSRSRRCFGALTLVEENGKPPEVPDPVSMATSSATVWLANDCPPKTTFESFAEKAGFWLKEQRKEAGKRKRDLFGDAGDKRFASPVMLRPWKSEGQFHLLLIAPPVKAVELGHHVTSQQPDNSQSKSDCPVAQLLSGTFDFPSIARYQKQVAIWCEEGRNDLVNRFVKLTQDSKYGGLRAQDWYPKE